MWSWGWQRGLGGHGMALCTVGWVLHDRRYDSLIPGALPGGCWERAGPCLGYSLPSLSCPFSPGALTREIPDPHEEGPGFLSSLHEPTPLPSLKSLSEGLPRGFPLLPLERRSGMGSLLGFPPFLISVFFGCAIQHVGS